MYQFKCFEALVNRINKELVNIKTENQSLCLSLTVGQCDVGESLPDAKISADNLTFIVNMLESTTLHSSTEAPTYNFTTYFTFDVWTRIQV